MQRLVKVQNPSTDLKVGLCLDPNDLALSKLAAGREKDWPFVAELIAHRFVDVGVLMQRLSSLAVENARKQKIQIWLAAKRER